MSCFFYCSILFKIHGGYTARGLTVVRPAKEAPFRHRQPRSLFTFSVLHLEHLEVRCCRFPCCLGCGTYSAADLCWAGKVRSVCTEKTLTLEQKVFINLVVPREICLVGYKKTKQ